MESVLLPQKKAEEFDPAKCYVTLEQIESMIEDAEKKRDRLVEEYNTMGDTIKKGGVTFTKNAIADMELRASSEIAALKMVRHMAYVTGGYRKE